MMNHTSGRNQWTAVDTVSYLMIGSVVGRMLPYYWPTDNRWPMVGLMSLYILLFTAARIISHRRPAILHPYFIVQLGITLLLLLVIPSYDGPQDYFAMLIMPISMQAMWRFGQKTGTRWVAVFAVFVAVCMIVYYQKYEGSWEGVGYGLVYVAAAIMISVFSTLTQRATSAHKESQALNAELAAANTKLQEYARQVEQLAAAEERSRLARDLHDSVSQTIFSLTLTAQAARILLDRDPARVAPQLDHLQELASSALAEMRSLIEHLRPEFADPKGPASRTAPARAGTSAARRPGGAADPQRRAAAAGGGGRRTVPRGAGSAQQRGQACRGEASLGHLAAGPRPD